MRPDDLALVLERRREDRLDSGEADRLGERHARAGGGVHQEEAVFLLDDRGDERLRQPDVLGGNPLRDAHDGRDELARDAGAQQDDAAVRHEGLEDLVHQELQELVHRDVAQELDRQLVDDPERLDQLGELFGREPRVGLLVLRAQQLRRGLQDRVVERVRAARLDAHAGRGLRLELQGDAADA